MTSLVNSHFISQISHAKKVPYLKDKALGAHMIDRLCVVRIFMNQTLPTLILYIFNLLKWRQK